MTPPTIHAPELNPLLADADHVDVQTTESDTTLREFVSTMIAWQPGWMRLLFRARWVFARLLRLRDPDIAALPLLRPEVIPFAPGGEIGIFTVVGATEVRYIVLEASDTHMAGYFAVVAEPVAGGRNRFRVATIVKDRRWTGPLYFNVIRPFNPVHHVVVRSMISAGARGESRAHR